MPLTNPAHVQYRKIMIDPLNPRTLQTAREAAKLTRAQLAEAAKVNETTILRIERGEVDPRLDGTWAPIVRTLMAVSAPAPAQQERAA